ncbi:RNA methyltransferase [Mycolicibacterium insubricum]|uniref:RNA methyltransferase n=1 Tax=Mycolicibacterium insubricum TaxID=444597 RepID=A0A1X0DI01_9MYCO|nr:RNA methyltransferase [Mycolicibacterium insubricum]ORA72014.1 RNA methyltransferase [Mycolicibacterium insubricum]
MTERSARVSAAAKLLRHPGRKRAGRFLAEGPNLVEAALARGLALEVFATADAELKHSQLLARADVPVHRITERAAKALSETVTPPGLVAVCTLPEIGIADLEAPRLVLVVVGLGEPGNAGTMIRTAHAMGADAVVLTGNSVDPYNGKCLRASAGSIFAIPVITEPDPDVVLDVLRAAGVQILATTLDGDLDLDTAGGRLAAPTAWLFGPEAHGLSADLALGADHRVRIPMPGGAESLNVAAAAAICLYVSARTRRGE